MTDYQRFEQLETQTEQMDRLYVLTDKITTIRLSLLDIAYEVNPFAATADEIEQNTKKYDKAKSKEQSLIKELPSLLADVKKKLVGNKPGTKLADTVASGVL